MSDQTVVTGTPTRGDSPRRGQVLGERYEIRAQLRNDAFSLGMLAFDQETEDRVVLRIVRPALLDHLGRASTYRALRSAVGVGGRCLPGLLDADKDGELVFAVEPVPEGASLRDVLDQRIADDRPMEPNELLPLVAHLETALAAIPPPLRHGDVRADNVWVDPHRLWLLGAFVVPSLPEGAVAAVLQKDSGLRRRTAPEVLRGTASDAADRFGIGAIVFEALTLRTPPEPGEAGEGLPMTPVGEAVRTLLHPDAGLRGKSLEPLLDALGRAAGLPVPEMDPGTFRAPRRLSVPRPGSVVPPLAKGVLKARANNTQETAVVSADDAHALLGKTIPPKTDVDRSQRATVDDDEGLPPPPSVSDDARTQQLPLSEVQSSDEHTTEPPPVDETAKVTPLSKKRAERELLQRMEAGGLDPRLVRAALDRSASAGHVDEEADVPDDGPIAEPDSMDPRLVRAALGVALSDSSEETVPLDPSVRVEANPEGTQELRLDDLEVEEEEEVELDPSVPAKPRAEGTQELRLDDLEVEEEEEVELDPSVPAKPRAEGTQELRLEDLEMQIQDEEQHAVRAPRAPARDVGLEDLEAMRRRRAVPDAGIQPIPRPRKDSLVGIRGPVLFDDSGGAAAPVEPEPAVVVRPPSDPPVRPVRDTERPIAPRVVVPRPRPARNWGAVIIVTALLLGAAIIIGSFAYVRYQKAQAEEELRLRIQERIERMRDPAE